MTLSIKYIASAAKRLPALGAPLFLLFALLALGACANIGSPSGGPRDEDPPLFVSSSPSPGARNVDRERIVLAFNELVNVKDAFSKVVTSPVGKGEPRVSSLGRRVTVQFDSLMPNTTYTIDFADAIEDNNEGNKLRNFSYTFSTGPDLDSLRISGRVLGARDLEPQQGMLVGVTRNLADSAFTRLRLLRVAKTDDRGRFVIRGLAPGEYRLYALADRDNDYTYSTPEEDLAFYPVTLSPSSRPDVALDTVYNKLTGAVDTVISRGRTLFLPNDILLRSFNSGKRVQYLSKYERPDSARVFLKFNAPADALPRIGVVNPPAEYDTDLPIGTVESSAALDSVVYWLRPELMRTDSLTLSVEYMRSADDGGLTLAADTLKLFHRRPVVKKKKQKEKVATASDSLAAITFAWNIPGGTHDVNKPLAFDVPAPLAYLDTAALHLLVERDSVYRPVPTPPRILRPDSLSPRRFLLEYPWDFGAKYKLVADTLAAMDIYGKVSRPASADFMVKRADDYCSMTFRLTGLDQHVPAFVELLNGSDAVVATSPVENGTAYFPFIAPGRYFARVIEDRNGNGLYDTGDYDLLRQPELAYYYPKAVNLKKNWDKEEDWDVFATAIDLQKPAALLKNKPAADKRARNSGQKKKASEEEEEEDNFDPTRNPFDPNDRGRNRQRLR